MGHFINARADLVAEAVDGLLLSSGGKLARLDGDPGHPRRATRRLAR